MTLQLTDIKISTVLPEIPTDLPVYLVRAASLEERQPAIQFFQELLQLEELVPVDEPDSLCYMGPDGEIQFYRPSGSLWVEDTRADKGYPDERRPWKVVEVPDENDPNNSKLVLIESDENRLARQAGELFEEAGLISSEASFAGVALDQVAQLDAEGKEVGRFVGKANARFLYCLDGVEVDGPGAKTYAFYNPGTERHTLTSIYHAWREVKDKRKIGMARIDEILERTLVQDPELRLYHQRGSSIELQQVDLVYLALGPDIHQDYVFPTLRVDGNVMFKSPSPEREGFEFSRFYHAATPQDYATSKLYAHYLVEQLG